MSAEANVASVPRGIDVRVTAENTGIDPSSRASNRTESGARTRTATDEHLDDVPFGRCQPHLAGGLAEQCPTDLRRDVRRSQADAIRLGLVDRHPELRARLAHTVVVVLDAVDLRDLRLDLPRVRFELIEIRAEDLDLDRAR